MPHRLIPFSRREIVAAHQKRLTRHISDIKQSTLIDLPAVGQGVAVCGKAKGGAVNLGDEDVHVDIEPSFTYEQVVHLTMNEEILGSGRNVLAKPREVVTLGFAVERGESRAAKTIG